MEEDRNMSICKTCGAQNSDQARFCESCGARFEEIVKAEPVTELPKEDDFVAEPAAEPVAAPVPAPVPAPVQYDNAQYQQQYQQQYQPQQPVAPAQPNGDYKTVCILALIFGCVAIVFDPFYLTSIAAIVLGVIGHTKSVNSKGMAIAGWILGIVSICIQVPLDIMSFGLGLFC